ncbi:MAG TPA: triose-phosphate isomerase [Phycisphaerales bacterium]|jgi:triosephosphate isomerase|nr:triose-phosphate isomerase [Phycisphaerales bacterium]|tara:strand:+ start:2634 stop:3395 length:762 start_codon:yes stop_codon:yes gene_type:complete
MTQRRFIIGGNWKMNTDLETGMALASQVADAASASEACDVVIYPPFPYLQAIDSVISNSPVTLGAQNIWPESHGAFTGEVSCDMLKELGVASVLVGHSERRHVLLESDPLIAKKVDFAINREFQVVLCVGETLEQREMGSTLEIVLGQVQSGLESVNHDSMKNIVIAYEPVWAIGTGKTASAEDAQAVHSAIRGELASRYDDDVASLTRIQYGGSVKPENAKELFACPDIDGALVGGAALSGESFAAIIEAAC